MGLVLFVCVENTFRSVLSEALFNAAPPPGWRAESAGVQAATAMLMEGPKFRQIDDDLLLQVVPMTVLYFLVAGFGTGFGALL